MTSLAESTRNTITLRLGECLQWYADYSGPHATRIKSLFGGLSIPTAYQYPMAPARVLDRITKLNPDILVRLEGAA